MTNNDTLLQKLMLEDDLTKFTDDQRIEYYKRLCDTLGLNPITKPFDYIVLDGKLQLYARKDCTEQLREKRQISIAITGRELQDTIYVVTSKATLPKGRTDEAIGAVSVIGKRKNSDETYKLEGTVLANAVMRAETKAKRRVTLSICGIGMLDESELDTVTAPPSGDSSAILERNVREATAHAVGDIGEIVGTSLGKPIYKSEEQNEYGPLNITEDNYKELVSHVGKAQGNMLGRKVGELHANVIEWMYKNWREKLGPSASDQDLRLSKAIKFAFHALSSDAAGDTVAHTSPPPAASAQPEDIGAKQAAINDLRQRIENVLLTEEQACGYLHKFGLFGEGWKTFDRADEKVLLYLCTPQGWKTFKDLLETEVKPKVVEKPKKGRKRAR